MLRPGVQFLSPAFFSPMKRIFLSLLIFLVFPGPAMARIDSYLYEFMPLTGIIRGKSRNTIEFTDEKSKETRNYIYIKSDMDQFQIGDRVRIYYSPRGSIIKDMRKMTKIEYNENGQNLGNVYHHP
jgi:hypothetical protein